MTEQHKKIADALTRAQHAAQTGDLKAAAHWAKIAAKQSPRDPLPCLLLGDMELASACFQSATKHYREALRRKPDLVAGHGNLGVAWLRQGEFQKAEQCFERVLRLHPHDVCALLNLGYAAQSQGRDEIALGYYRQVIAIDPGFL